MTSVGNLLNVAAEPAVHILGSRVHLVNAEKTVQYVEQWIEEESRTCHQVVVTGFHGLMEAYKKPAICTVLNSADLWVPDGIAPVWLARVSGHREAVRAPGAEIMSEFFRVANQKHFSSYFFGDTDATLEALSRTVSEKYPGHRVAGSFSPPFRKLSEAEEDEIIDRINQARPDVLWVALGLPKQDVWIYDRLHKLKVPVAIGVGAAFAFVAGTVDRCPEWIGKAGFEWVYRFCKEPKKLWRRDLLDGPQFIYHAGRELLRSEVKVARLSNHAE